MSKSDTLFLNRKNRRDGFGLNDTIKNGDSCYNHCSYLNEIKKELEEKDERIRELENRIDNYHKYVLENRGIETMCKMGDGPIN